MAFAVRGVSTNGQTVYERDGKYYIENPKRKKKSTDGKWVVITKEKPKRWSCVVGDYEATIEKGDEYYWGEITNWRTGKYFDTPDDETTLERAQMRLKKRLNELNGLQELHTTLQEIMEETGGEPNFDSAYSRHLWSKASKLLKKYGRKIK